MPTCIYCEAEEATSSEHIIQNALGSDWERVGILCPTCNSLFGNTIDKILADDFVFFRNYLAIKGKKGDIPDLTGTLSDGTPFIRKGETADLIKKIPPHVQRVADEESHKIFSVHAQVLQTEGVRKGIEKGAVKDGFPNMFTEVRDYEANNPGVQSYSIAINVATVVALYKSIINYAHICIGNKYRNIKYDCSSRVHDFAYILKEFPDKAGNVADDLSIHGIPMTFSLKKTLQDKLKKDNSHTLFLIEHRGSLYGGFLLFGHIPLAYRIIREWEHGEIAFATFIDYGTQKHVDIGVNYEIFNAKITFRTQDRPAFCNLVNSHFPKVVEDCIIMDMKKTLFNTMDGGDIANFFPIKDKTVIKKILKERLRIMFKILTKAQGPFDYFFDSDISDELTLPIINKFFTDLDIKELNRDTYSAFTYSSVKKHYKIISR